MPDIFDEVAEDLRAERNARLARRYGGLAVGAVLLVLAGTAGLQAWRWNQARQAEAAATTYLSLHRTAEREGADLRAAATGFAELARSAPEGYPALARLRAAALRAETGDLPGATALWDELAANAGADPLYRDLATLLSVTHNIEAGDPAALAARLRPLLAEGNPWRASAREAEAVLALRRGNAEEARRAFQALAADAATPPAMRERAGRLASGTGG
ncbi:MAG TPA: tetratricopeptide repeat protein [Acetobacteraceae bacterium]|nr:tetratricopeptide repeat protein [Acetobacteraceae bacterium]